MSAELSQLLNAVDQAGHEIIGLTQDLVRLRLYINAGRAPYRLDILRHREAS